jgi:hypothetical protein
VAGRRGGDGGEVRVRRQGGSEAMVARWQGGEGVATRRAGAAWRGR